MESSAATLAHDTTPAPRGRALSHARLALEAGRTMRHRPGDLLHPWFMALTFPLSAGLLLFGWRAAEAIAAVLAATLLSYLLWKRVGSRGRQLRLGQCLWSATALSMMLPASLATLNGDIPIWPVLATAGLLVVIVHWTLGCTHDERVSPVLLCFFLLAICFGPLLMQQTVLQRSRLLVGDVRNASEVVEPPSRSNWLEEPQSSAHDATRRDPVSQRLIAYTTGTTAGWQSLDGLLRDQAPALEDLIIAGQPGAIGLGSGIALLVAGLFLIYRNAIDYRIPLLMIVVAYLAMLFLPIPTLISPESGAQWRWMIFRQGGIGWSTTLTFLNYELLASPMIWTAFFLAPWPTIRPMTRRGRTVFACVAGLLTAVLQLYVYTTPTMGPYIAVFLASLLSPMLDRWFCPRPLV